MRDVCFDSSIGPFRTIALRVFSVNVSKEAQIKVDHVIGLGQGSAQG